MLLVWRHNYFGQDVVFREQPQLPAGMSPDTTRLEIVTEMVEVPEPAIRKQTVRAGNAGSLDDDVVINFGRLAFVMGKAFPVTNDVGWAVGGLNSSEGSLPVLKQWHTLSDGRMFLIESVGWADAQPHLKELPSATQARATPASEDKTAVARVWPERPRPLADAKPLEVARLSYQPKGYVVDFFIIPDDQQPTTFMTGQTYYIKTSYSSGMGRSPSHPRARPCPCSRRATTAILASRLWVWWARRIATAIRRSTRPRRRSGFTT